MRERAFVEGTADAFSFALAERLHMTVGELEREMSNDEYLRWAAYYKWQAAQREISGAD